MIANLFVALLAGHLLGDFLIQQHTWSQRKTAPGPAGWAWCALHAATYTAACWATVLIVAPIDGLDVDAGALALGMVVNLVTHAVLDRRWPLEKLVRATGHGGWLDNDPRALFIYDQVVHALVLYWIAVGIAAAS